IGPPLGDHVVELGLGAHGAAGPAEAGGGGVGWVAVQGAPGWDVIGSAEATEFVGLPAATARQLGVAEDEALPPRLLWSANLGGRTRTLMNKGTLHLGFEALVDFQQSGDLVTGPRFASVIVGMPVAEQA